jgi:hypothetical protein
VPGPRHAWNAPKQAEGVYSGKLPAIDSKLAFHVLHFA